MPTKKWVEVITYVIKFLLGVKSSIDIEIKFPKPVLNHVNKKITNPNDAKNTVKRGILWIENSKILNNDGKDGVKEGFYHHI